MVGSIFETLGDVIAGYVGAISEMFSSLIAIFYVEQTGLTLIGTLLLLAVGIGVVVWGFNMVVNLINL